jgi:hypothetical protein
MTTPNPTGKLAYGQAANYDAVDDRAVVTAVTGGRLGLVRPVSAVAGTGLQIVVRAGWVGTASCDDLTSAVVGSREDMIVQANPGPASGPPRNDVIWCSTNPDEGTFELSVMTLAQSAGRSGLPLVNVLVPAGTNLASGMQLVPVDARIDRRTLSVTYMGTGGGFNDYNATSWGAAVGRGVESLPCFMEPGQWYRVRYIAHCCSLVGTIPPAGTRLEGAVAIGERTEGQLAVNSILRRGYVFAWPFFTVPTMIQAEYVFRHNLNDAPVWRVFDGRIWKHPTNVPANVSIRPGGYTDMGPFIQTFTVEDIGS